MQVSDAVLARLMDLIPHRDNVLWAGVAGECNGAYALHIVRRTGAPTGATSARDGDLSVMIGNLDPTSIGQWMSRSASHINMLYVPHILIGPDISVPAARSVMAANNGALPPNIFLQPTLSAINEAGAAAARRATLATTCTSLRMRAMHEFVANNGRLPADSAEFYRSVSQSTAPWALSVRKATRDHDDFSAANFLVHTLPAAATLPPQTLTATDWSAIQWGFAPDAPQINISAPVGRAESGLTEPASAAASAQLTPAEPPAELSREERIAARALRWLPYVEEAALPPRYGVSSEGQATRHLANSASAVTAALSR